MADQLPGYYSTKPQLKEIKKLKKVLGYYDSSPTTIELLIKFFEEETTKLNVTCEQALLDYSGNSMIKSFNIKSFPEVKKQIHDLYILNVFNVVDPFFRDLKTTLKKFFGDKQWKTKDGKEDLDAFNQIVENCSKEQVKVLKSKPEYHLINFYRLHRNAIVHRTFEDEQFDATDEFFRKNILIHKNYFVETYGVNAPNSSKEINFTDFILYTRAIKYYVNLISDACYEIVEKGLLDFSLSKDKLSKDMKALSNAKERKKERPLRKFISIYFDINDLDKFASFYHQYIDHTYAKSKKGKL